jgi:hypothetical protein
MLDPTWVPFNNDIWSKLETEQQFLVGHPRGVDLREIRYSPPEESPLVATHDAELGADGTLTGRVRIEGRGAADGRLRRSVQQNRKRALEDVVAEMLARMGPAVQITRLKHRVVDDFAGDMWLEVEYRIPGFALQVGEGLEFCPPAANALKDHPLLFRAGSVDWAKERKTDVFLYYTQRLDITEKIRIPAGYHLDTPPQLAAVDETFAAFAAEVEQRGRTLNLHARTDVRRRQIPPSGYEGFKKAIDALDGYAGTSLRIAKGGAR